MVDQIEPQSLAVCPRRAAGLRAAGRSGRGLARRAAVLLAGGRRWRRSAAPVHPACGLTFKASWSLGPRDCSSRGRRHLGCRHRKRGAPSLGRALDRGSRRSGSWRRSRSATCRQPGDQGACGLLRVRSRTEQSMLRDNAHDASPSGLAAGTGGPHGIRLRSRRDSRDSDRRHVVRLCVGRYAEANGRDRPGGDGAHIRGVALWFGKLVFSRRPFGRPCASVAGLDGRSAGRTREAAEIVVGAQSTTAETSVRRRGSSTTRDTRTGRERRVIK